MKVDTMPDCTTYYSYNLVYIDDILIISHYPKRYMSQLQDAYYVKTYSIGPPSLYFGAQVKCVQDHSNRTAYTSSSNKYVKKATMTVKQRTIYLNISSTKSIKSPSQNVSHTKCRTELALT